MNERIDEIAFEAGCHRHKYCNPKHPDLDGYIISQEALDKFAQLIVKECIREIGHKSADLLDIDFYPHYQERLKKHFEVEE